jgi:hypothetical protein
VIDGEVAFARVGRRGAVIKKRSQS